MKEFDHGNAREGRSTSCASYPRIKTYQNSLKSPNQTKANWGYFLGIFKIGKLKENFAGIGGNKGQIRGNLEL